jgi:hypothetical protein
MIMKTRLSALSQMVACILLGLLCLTGCSAITTATPTLSVGAAGDHPPTEGSNVPEMHCPAEKTLFSLWFSHLAVLDIDAGGGETIYLKWENTPPSFFDFWVDADGTISSQEIIRTATIDYQGTATHPDSNDCPVQTFAGSWEMQATITGTCQRDQMKVHIVEEWVDPVLNSDCTGPVSPGPGIYSAPELDLEFDLSDPYPSDFLQIPEGGTFYASYAYIVWPAGYILPIVPSVPEQ